MKYLLIFFFFLMITVSTRANSESSKSPVYVIRYTSSGWRLDIEVNGVLVLRADKGIGQTPIIRFLVNGNNTIALSATQVKDNAESLCVSIISLGVSEQNNSTVSEFINPPTHVGASFKKTVTFQGTIPVIWSWEESDDVRILTKEDEDKIYQVVQRLAESISKKDLKLHNSLRSIAIDDIMKFYGAGRIPVENSLDKAYEKLFQDPKFNVKVRTRDELNFESFGQITLVSCKQLKPEDWTVGLRTSDPNSTFDFGNLYFSRFKGEWKLIN